MSGAQGKIRLLAKIKAGLLSLSFILPLPVCSSSIHFNIQPASLEVVLSQYIIQSGEQVVFRTKDIKNVMSQGVVGNFETKLALKKLLLGSDLSIVRAKNGAAMLVQSSLLENEQVDEYLALNSSDTAQFKNELNEPEDSVETIQVSGLRASSAQNLNIKRFSNSVLDAITAEDIGKFPDKNVADSLSRVPGIVITRTSGEGEQVSIRGMAPGLTYTQLNGNFISSSPREPSRSFHYSLLPSAFIHKVELFKTSEARIDEGGIGGTVVLHTRKPLEMRANSGVLKAEATWLDIGEGAEPHYTGIYSWKDESETYGFLAGYTLQKLTHRSLGSWFTKINKRYPLQERFNHKVEAGAATYFAPQYVKQDVTKKYREREGIQFTGQWRPTEELELGLNYFHFALQNDFDKNRFDFPEWYYNNVYLVNVQGDETTGMVNRLDFSDSVTGQQAEMKLPWLRAEKNIQEFTSNTYDFFASYQGDSHSTSIKLGRTESDGAPKEFYRTAYYLGVTGRGNPSSFYGWRMQDRQLFSYVDPNLIKNVHAGVGGAEDVGSTNSGYTASEQYENYAQIDINYSVAYGPIEQLRFGAKYRDGNTHRESRQSHWVNKGFNAEAADINGSLSQFDSYQYNNGIPELASVLQPESLGGLKKAVNTNLFPAIDWQKYRQYLTDNYNLYTQVVDNDIYNLNERISALYLQADYSWQELRGNIGMRYVNTKTSGISTDTLVYNLDYKNEFDERFVDLPGGEVNRIEIFEPIYQQKQKSYLLPSFNITWAINEDWVLRGAAAKTIARPEYNALGGVRRLTYQTEEWSKDYRGRVDFNDSHLPGWHGSGGNRSLLPMESTQFDISLEYYYGQGSGVGIAIFQKDVDNFVVDLSVDITQTVPEHIFTLPEHPDVTEVTGGDILVQKYSTKANGTDAESHGVELFVQHFFANGFGINANYTRNQTNEATISLDGTKIGQTPLIGSADYQVNVSVFFENELFNVRVSLNRRGPVVDEYNSEWQANRYYDVFNQVDVNASVNLTENLMLHGSINNLLEETDYLYLGKGNKNRFAGEVYTGKRLFMGLTYKF